VPDAEGGDEADAKRQKQADAKAAKEAKARTFEERRLANERKKAESERLFALRKAEGGGEGSLL
jgi:hypothetical protein